MVFISSKMRFWKKNYNLISSKYSVISLQQLSISLSFTIILSEREITLESSSLFLNFSLSNLKVGLAKIDTIKKLSKFSLNISTSCGLLMPSTTILFSIPSSMSFLIFLMVNSATMYCPNSALKFLAVSLELSPLFLAS